MILAIGIMLATQDPSAETQVLGGWLIGIAFVLYLVAAALGVTWSWENAFREEFDKKINAFCRGLDGAYETWVFHKTAGLRIQVPSTWRNLAPTSDRWILSYADVLEEGDLLLMEFCEWVYPRAQATQSHVPLARQADFEDARESMADYLAPAASRAQRPFLFRRWLRKRVADRKDLLPIYLCVDLALRRRRSGRLDLGGGGLEHVSALFKPSTPDT